VDVAPETLSAYLGHAFRQMLAVADRLGDDLVNRRPHGPDTNEVAALVVHCCGVTEFWLGHVARGRPTTRDRDAEFRTESTVAGLHDRVAAVLATAADDLDCLERRVRTAGDPSAPGHGFRSTVPGDGSDVAVVIHVIEELYQHLGQMELTADTLTAAPRG
jgi:hypothetical protein